MYQTKDTTAAHATDSEVAQTLNTYFATCTMRTASGKVVEVLNDGRAGDGMTWWRAVYTTGRPQKVLVGISSWPRVRGLEVKVAIKGDLRDRRCAVHKFKSASDVARWLRANL